MMQTPQHQPVGNENWKLMSFSIFLTKLQTIVENFASELHNHLQKSWFGPSISKINGIKSIDFRIKIKKKFLHCPGTCKILIWWCLIHFQVELVVSDSNFRQGSLVTSSRLVWNVYKSSWPKVKQPNFPYLGGKFFCFKLLDFASNIHNWRKEKSCG